MPKSKRAKQKKPPQPPPPPKPPRRPAYELFKKEYERGNDPPDKLLAFRHPILLAMLLSSLWARACPIAQRDVWDDAIWDAIPYWQKRWFAHCIPAITWCIMAGQLRCSGDDEWGMPCGRFCIQGGPLVAKGEYQWNQRKFVVKGLEPVVRCVECNNDVTTDRHNPVCRRFCSFISLRIKSAADLAALSLRKPLGWLRVGNMGSSLFTSTPVAPPDVCEKVNAARFFDVKTPEDDDGDISVIQSLPKLRRLVIGVNDEDAVDPLMSELCKCPLLESLCLESVPLDVRFDAVARARWERLQTLQLWHCTFDEDVVEAIAYCERLWRLEIVDSKTKVTAAMLTTLLSELKRLEEVTLCYALADDVTPDAAKSSAGCPLPVSLSVNSSALWNGIKVLGLRHDHLGNSSPNTYRSRSCEKWAMPPRAPVSAP